MNNWNKQSDDIDQEVTVDYNTGEQTNSQPARKKKTTPEMKQVFELFDNPEKKVWHMRAIQREAAQVLFDTYGMEVLERRMRIIKREQEKGDPFFPLVSSPQLLLEKMDAVERYLKQ